MEFNSSLSNDDFSSVEPTERSGTHNRDVNTLEFVADSPKEEGHMTSKEEISRLMKDSIDLDNTEIQGTEEARPAGRHGVPLMAPSTNSPSDAQDPSPTQRVKKFQMVPSSSDSSSGSSDGDEDGGKVGGLKQGPPAERQLIAPSMDEEEEAEEESSDKMSHSQDIAVSVSEDDQISEPFKEEHSWHSSGIEEVVIEEASLWDNCVKEMVLHDCSHCSKLFFLRQFDESGEEIGESCIKILTFFEDINTPSSKQVGRAELQKKMLHLAANMIHTQNTIEKKHLNICSPKTFSEAVCRGFSSIHLDSKLRLIADVEIEPCVVSLSDVMAFAGASLSQNEVLSLLKSIVLKVKCLHECGVKHGALHGNNVLFSTDNGHSVLTSPGGVMSNVVFPSDLSYLSPRVAHLLEERIGSVWDEEGVAQPGRIGKSVRSEEEKLLAHVLLLMEEGENIDASRSPFIPSFSDDLYAIGTIALSLVLGSPVFHGTRYIDVIRTLSALRKSAARMPEDTLMRTLFSSLLQCDYFALRMRQADYSADFLHCLEHFILDCMSSSLGLDKAKGTPVTYKTAADLFTHPLFRRFPLVNAVGGLVYSEQEVEEQLVEINDIVHRTVYPIYATIESIRKDVGSTPYVKRFHRNSIFAARISLLQHSVTNALTATLNEDSRIVHRLAGGKRNKSLFGDVSFALWPYVNHTVWKVRAPSVRSCAAFACATSAGKDELSYVGYPKEIDTVSLAALSPAELQLVNRIDMDPVYVDGEFAFYGNEFVLPFPAKTLNARSGSLETHSSSFSNEQQERLERIQLETGCVLLPHLHAIIFSNESGAVLRLSRQQLSALNTPSLSFDTLILKDLKDCNVSVLAFFRYVVISNVQTSEVQLGPSFAAYLSGVKDCTSVSLASTYLLFNGVHRTTLHYSGSTQPHAMDENSFSEINLLPYNLTYCGLTEDYARAGLPFEQQTTLSLFAGQKQGTFDDTEDDASEENEDEEENHVIERDLTLVGVERAGHDYPYSHALAASGNRFIHRDDDESDVFLYYNEISQKDILLANIHGKLTLPKTEKGNSGAGPSSLSSSPSAFSLFSQLLAQGHADELHERGNSNQGASNEGEIAHGCFPHNPVLFFLDVLGDVNIENCSYCTIFVCGSIGSVLIRGCHHANIFVVGKEMVVEQSDDLKLFAFITEYFEIVKSSRVVIEPLYLRCPHFDAILEAIVANRTDDEEDGSVYEYFNTHDVDRLNIVLSDGVTATESVDVTVMSQKWFAEAVNHLPTMVTIPLLIDDEDNEEENLPGCKFFTNFCERMEIDLDSAFQSKPFSSFLYNHAAFPSKEGSHNEMSLLSSNSRGTEHNSINANSNNVFEQPKYSIVRFHDLLNCSILRTYNLSPVIPHPLISGHLPSDTSLVLDRICGGTFHFVAPVHNLYIRNCSGPLDIAVCAVQNVVLENCENVVLRTACFTFASQDCHHCHVALHVNTQPRYLRCSSMMTSPLNITTVKYEEILDSVGIQLDLNLYDRPVILDFRSSDVFASASGMTSSKSPENLSFSKPIADIKEWNPHYYCPEEFTEDPRRSDEKREDGNLQISSLADAFALLRKQVTVVAPLEGLCVGVRDVPFLERLEGRVVKEEDLPDMHDVLLTGLSYFAVQPDLPSADRELASLESERVYNHEKKNLHSSPPTRYEDVAIRQFRQSPAVSLSAEGEHKHPPGMSGGVTGGMGVRKMFAGMDPLAHAHVDPYLNVANPLPAALPANEAEGDTEKPTIDFNFNSDDSRRSPESGTASPLLDTTSPPSKGFLASAVPPLSRGAVAGVQKRGLSPFYEGRGLENSVENTAARGVSVPQTTSLLQTNESLDFSPAAVNVILNAPLNAPLTPSADESAEVGKVKVPTQFLYLESPQTSPASPKALLPKSESFEVPNVGGLENLMKDVEAARAQHAAYRANAAEREERISKAKEKLKRMQVSS